MLDPWWPFAERGGSPTAGLLHRLPGVVNGQPASQVDFETPNPPTLKSVQKEFNTMKGWDEKALASLS